jgi:hypothetical protein
MHLDDLARDRQAQACVALDARVRAVDLEQLLEDPIALFRWSAGSGIAGAHGKVAIYCASADANLPGVRELNGVGDEIEQHLGQALLVAEALRNLGFEGELAASDSVATITISTMLPNAYSPMFSLNWPASILETSMMVLIKPRSCLPLGRIRRRIGRDFSGRDRCLAAKARHRQASQNTLGVKTYYATTFDAPCT